MGQPSWTLALLALACGRPANPHPPTRRAEPLTEERVGGIEEAARRLLRRGGLNSSDARCATPAPLASPYFNATPTCYLVPPVAPGAKALVYWHVPKAASSTVRRCVFNFLQNWRRRNFTGGTTPTWDAKVTTPIPCDSRLMKRWRSWWPTLEFGVARDPLDKFVSAYAYLHRGSARRCAYVLNGDERRRIKGRRAAGVVRDRDAAVEASSAYYQWESTCDEYAETTTGAEDDGGLARLEEYVRSLENGDEANIHGVAQERVYCFPCESCGSIDVLADVATLRDDWPAIVSLAIRGAVDAATHDAAVADASREGLVQRRDSARATASAAAAEGKHERTSTAALTAAAGLGGEKTAHAPTYDGIMPPLCDFLRRDYALFPWHDPPPACVDAWRAPPR